MSVREYLGVDDALDWSESIFWLSIGVGALFGGLVYSLWFWFELLYGDDAQ